MSPPYEFSIPKGRMIRLAVCAGVIQLLLYGAGIATGMIIRTKRVAAAEQVPPVKQTAATAPQTQATADKQPAPIADTKPPASAPQQALRPYLTVQAASFREKDNALKLAAILKDHGFGQVTVGEYQDESEAWHFVSLGPFHEWEEASRVAAQLDRSWDLHAWVRPVSN